MIRPGHPPPVTTSSERTRDQERPSARDGQQDGQPGVGDDPERHEGLAERAVQETFRRSLDEGRRRLSRRTWPLLATGVLGGIDVGTGVLALLLVEHTTHSVLLAGLAFSIGFVAVTLARSELFTEDFLVPVTTVVARQARTRMLLRLWVGTLVANLVGGWVFTYVMMKGFPEFADTAITAGGHYVDLGLGMRAFSLAVLGGAVITLMTWMQHSTESVAVKLVPAVTAGFLLAAAQLNHAVVNSLLMFAALQTGRAPFGYLDWAGTAGLAAVGNLVGRAAAGDVAAAVPGARRTAGRAGQACPGRAGAGPAAGRRCLTPGLMRAGRGRSPGMRALALTPGTADSLRLADLPEPPDSDGPVLVDALAVGLCGTDMEILAGEYGQAPPGEDLLVLGHENLGRVRHAPDGCGLAEGDLVVGIVRRPDPVPCPACAVGQWDMCRNGQYVEHGIKGLHGFAREHWRGEPDAMVRLDPALGDLGVLLEPATILAKAWEQVERIGRRAWFDPQVAVVTGAGPVGLLAALLGVQRGLQVHVFDLVTAGPKPKLVRDLGATYHSGSLPDSGVRADVLVECTGVPSVVLDVMHCGAPDSVACLTGVSSTGSTRPVDVGALNREAVLGNDVVFGSVNANRGHYEAAAAALARADRDWLGRLVTRRVPMASYREAFTPYRRRREGRGGAAVSRIEDYALLGDLQSAALVARTGSVDWLCLPAFDSAACFAALLGDEQAGRWLLAPEAGGECTARRYLPGTMVLETTWRTADGEVRVLDLMPPRGQAPDVVRIVEGVSGSVAMRSDLRLRFDYGARMPWVRHSEHGLSAVAGPDAVTLHCGVDVHGEAGSSVSAFRVTAGQRVPFVLTWHPSHQSRPRPVDAEQALAQTVSFWQDWSGRSTVHGPYREAVQRSLLTLKALTYAPTGGIVAAATTSLPEQLGGPRNWDYRYCWLRDASGTLQSLLAAGYVAEAKAWRDWLLRAAAGDPADLQIMYGLDGRARLPEAELDWLPGYEGSRPVRTGNAASEQLQLDVWGEVLDALSLTRRASLHAAHDAWDLQVALMEHLEGAWQQPDNGLWEVRGPRRHFTHSKVMAWVAADRMAGAVRHSGLPGPGDRWAALRDEIHADVLAHGYDADRQTFTQSYGGTALDASLLLVGRVGFLPPDDPRVAGTVAAVQRELTRDGFVLRYRTGATDDGLPGGEGVFLACSFWLVDALFGLGRRDEARTLFERLLDLRNDVGLLSEEWDPVAGRQLGNTPQAFSHFPLVTSALALSGGRSRRSDEAPDEAGRWEGG